MSFQIKFYNTDKPYGCFSNFSKHPIFLDEKTWPTTEHYFQAMKFVGTRNEEEIREASTPMEAARLGRSRQYPIRKDWEDVKVDLMEKAISAKIEQHEIVKDILLSTGSCELIEHTSNDKYWGDGGDGSGVNMLGRILMQVRDRHPDASNRFFVPQWIRFPEVHPVDMFWRMGAGEDYVMHLAEWFYSLSQEAQNEWESYFPMPKDWKELHCATQQDDDLNG